MKYKPPFSCLKSEQSWFVSSLLTLDSEPKNLSLPILDFEPKRKLTYLIHIKNFPSLLQAMIKKARGINLIFCMAFLLHCLRAYTQTHNNLNSISTNILDSFLKVANTDVTLSFTNLSRNIWMFFGGICVSHLVKIECINNSYWLNF